MPELKRADFSSELGPPGGGGFASPGTVGPLFGAKSTPYQPPVQSKIGEPEKLEEASPQSVDPCNQPVPYLYVLDLSNGQATLVEWEECRIVSSVASIAAVHGDATTVTTDIITNVTVPNMDSCQVALKCGNLFVIPESITNADAAFLIRGTWSERIDGDDALWVDNDLILWSLAQPEQLAGLAEGQVILGERDLGFLGGCRYKPYFSTPETRRTVTTTFPAGFVTTFSVVLVELFAKYSNVPPTQVRCVLTPGIPRD